MNSPEQYNAFDLPNGCSVRVYDHTKVYFGDYHHVRLEIICSMPLPDDAADPGVDGTDPRGEVIYNRLLERMAVPSAAVEEVRQELLAEFKKNSLHYLAAGDFPAKLAARRDGQQKDVRKRYTGILD